jgi:hypothetical protein
MSRKPQYRRAIVTLIDILGFREIVQRAEAGEVLDYLTVKDNFGFRAPFDKPKDFRSHSFSDLIVTCHPIPEGTVSHQTIFRLFSEIVRTGFHQWWLTGAGIFVRGGITAGPIHSSSKHVFGPGLVRAYEIESGIAKWPIIALDEALIKALVDDIPSLLKQDLVSEKEIFAKQLVALGLLFSLLARTGEGVWFIDYLDCLAYEDSTTGDLPYYLEQHRRDVCKARELSSNPKLDFLAGYHNHKVKDFLAGRDDLLIPDAMVSLDTEFPVELTSALEALHMRLDPVPVGRPSKLFRSSSRPRRRGRRDRTA